MRYLRIYLIAALFCLASIAQAQTNVLRVGSVTSPAGKTAIIPVELDNASDIMGVQFDIDVPYDLSVSEGVPVVNLSATRCVNHRVESHQTSASRWRDPSTHGGVSSYKTYRFIVYSDENTRLQGSTGTLLTLEMPLPDDLANGTVFPVYLMENSVVLSNRDKVNLVTGQQNGQVTIEVVPRPDLLPTDIKVAQTLASPGDQLDFSWTVKNQGDLATGAGWTERLYLENQTTGSRVYVGTQSYDGTLAVGASVQRNATLTLGELPGISGMCRPVVQIVPSAGCGEITLNQDNNTLAAKSYTLRVEKFLLLTANKTVIPKNSTGGYYCELRRTGNSNLTETFNISSRDKAGNTDRLRFSDNGQVTFRSGATKVGFYVYPVANDRFDIDPRVAIIVNEALNNGYNAAVDSVTMEETNQVPLTFKLDKTDYNEGDVMKLTVSVPVRPWEGQLAVYLNIEQQKRFKMPQRVVFEEGALEASVNITVLQDNTPANDMSVKISGTAEHYQKGEVLFMLHDDDMPAIQMTLTPNTVSEGAGPQAVYGTITRSEVTNNKITIKLDDDGVNDIYYSVRSITMNPGTTTVNFPLGVIDNQQVDGDRKVRIRAAVYMTDCGCESIGDKQAVVMDSIMITDDDGATLTLTASKPTILEGDILGTELTVSRNTDGGPAVTVNFTSDGTDVVFPATVTIPAGEQSAKIRYYAKANDVQENDRTVSVIASAEGYGAGSTWLLISDRTRPDATVKDVRLSDCTYDDVLVTWRFHVSDSVNVHYTISNIGSAPLPAGTLVRLYTGDYDYKTQGYKWADFQLPAAIPAGESKRFQHRLRAPQSLGFLGKVVCEVNPDQAKSELLYTNNTGFSNAYVSVSDYWSIASVTTDKKVVSPGEPITVTVKGQFDTDLHFESLAGRSVELALTQSDTNVMGTFVSGYTEDGEAMYGRTFVTLDENGEGSITLWPRENVHKGKFNLKACIAMSGQSQYTDYGSFEVRGMERATNEWITHDLYCDPIKDETGLHHEWQEGSIRVRNLCGETLHNVRIGRKENGIYCLVFDHHPTELPGYEPIDLPPYGEGEVRYRVSANAPSTSNDWWMVALHITCDEGFDMPVIVYAHGKHRAPYLTSTETNINTAVTVDNSMTFPVPITNTGSAETGPITVSIPESMAGFISLASPSVMGSLKEGETATVMVRFTGSTDVNIIQHGSIAINCENGGGINVPFSVKVVSETRGSLHVLVEDETTIYGDKDGKKPYVDNAKVWLKDYNTGALLFEGNRTEFENSTTSGVRYEFNQIPEGYYELYVSADRHDSYTQNIRVSPGVTTTHTATCPYQAVNVTWDVVETTVEDEYEIVPTFTYETSVPVPVVTMTCPDSLFIYDEIEYGKQTLFYIVLRNEGLITAQNLQVDIPSVEGFTFTPLIDVTGLSLAAQQSMTIPVRVTRDEAPEARRGQFRITSLNGAARVCKWKGKTKWEWPCGHFSNFSWIASVMNLIPTDKGGAGICYNTTWGGGGNDYGAPPMYGGGDTSQGTTKEVGDITKPLEKALCTIVKHIPDPMPFANVIDLAALLAGMEWADTEEGMQKQLGKLLREFASGYIFPDDEGPIATINEILDVFDAPKIELPAWLSLLDGEEHGLKDVLGVVKDDWTWNGKTLKEHAEEGTFDGWIGKLAFMGYDAYEYTKEHPEFGVLATNPMIPTTWLRHYSPPRKAEEGASANWMKARERMLLYANYCKTCYWDLWDITGSFIWTNYLGGSTDGKKTSEGTSMLAAVNAIYGYMMEKFEQEAEARQNMVLHAGGLIWPNSWAGPFSYPDMNEIRQFMSPYEESGLFYDFDMQKFVDRIRNTYCSLLPGYGTLLEAIEWKPNSKKNVINFNNLRRNSEYRDSIDVERINLGYATWSDLLKSYNEYMLAFMDEPAQTACAKVRLEIEQKLVMTRQAFRGTLTIENDLNEDLTDIDLSLLVQDMLGNVATSHEMQINFESIDGFEGNVEGPWTLGPRAKGVATILFIPTKYAAPEEETVYAFGGTLYFTSGGEQHVRNLYPVQLTVKPSPELDLTYFLQRDIYGDNPLTKDVVEPIVPAEFTVLLHNKGKGEATNVRMLTKQPRIIENEKGLFVDFAIIGSRLKDKEVPLALDSTVATQFGDIKPDESTWATWDLTSTLLGHFTEYDVRVNHVTSYGNPDLSLLDQVTIHPLIKSMALPEMPVYFGTTQATPLKRYWLVNDDNDAMGQPDMLYCEDGTTYPVTDYSNHARLTYDGDGKWTVTATDLTEGWVYISVADPSQGNSTVTPEPNERGELVYGTQYGGDIFWQTQYSMINGMDPYRDNKIHMVVYVPGNTTRLSFHVEPGPELHLGVKNIDGVPSDKDIAEQPVTQVDVTFNKKIQENTFDSSDLVLRYEGEIIPNSENISFVNVKDAGSQKTDSIFTVKLNAPDVQKNGYYSLTVNTTGITDHEGFPGVNGRVVRWMVFKDGLIQYNIEPWPTATAGGVDITNESGDPIGGSDTAYGSTLLVTATPDEGYDFSYWGTVDREVETVEEARQRRLARRAPEAPIDEGDISFLSKDNPISLTMTQLYNVRAVFKPQEFTVTVVCNSEEGTVNQTTARYPYGTVVDFKSTAREGYAPTGFSVGETTMSETDTWQLTVTDNVTVQVNFRSTATPNVILNEAIDYVPVTQTANVSVVRTYQKGVWNTICLPFGISDPAAVFGTGTLVAQLDGIDDNTVLFATVNAMEANKPYLLVPGSIYRNSSLAHLASMQVLYNISEAELQELPAEGVLDVKGGVEMTGTYVDYLLPENDGYFSLTDNMLYLVETGDEVSSGRFRAYFRVPTTSYQALAIAIDGVVTRIDESVRTNAAGWIPNMVYDLQGRRMMKDEGGRLKNLKPGVYILNGRKIVIK